MIERELDALLPESGPGDIITQAIRFAVFGGAQRIRRSCRCGPPVDWEPKLRRCFARPLQPS